MVHSLFINVVSSPTILEDKFLKAPMFLKKQCCPIWAALVMSCVLMFKSSIVPAALINSLPVH